MYLLEHFIFPIIVGVIVGVILEAVRRAIGSGGGGLPLGLQDAGELALMFVTWGFLGFVATGVVGFIVSGGAAFVSVGLVGGIFRAME